MPIKKEEGTKRTFSTGADKQSSEGKGTPVLFPPDAYLEISIHFEEGAALHGDRNWEAGIPLSELINSLERHIQQEKMGLTDESHDRAIAWNAVVYLATKLRIKAGILPIELADILIIYPNETDMPQTYPTKSKPLLTMCTICKGAGHIVYFDSHHLPDGECGYCNGTGLIERGDN